MGFAAFLSHEFGRRRQRNARYSLRAFARDLSCDHATLSQWMRGARPMSAASIGQIAKALGLSAQARRCACEFEAFDLAVIAAIGDASAPTSPALAKALNATTDAVNLALHRLLRLGLLTMDGTRWRTRALEEQA